MIKHRSKKRSSIPQAALFVLLALGLPAYLISQAAQPLKSPLKSEMAALTIATPLVDAQPDKLTVMTYNIGYASGKKNNLGAILTREEVIRNLDELALSIRNLNPDIIGLQEVDFDASRTFGINQLEYLAQKTGLPYNASAITWNKRYIPWPYWPPKLHFGKVISGQGILSRYPITHQDLIVFEKPRENPIWYNWFYLDRIVQNVTVKLPEGNLSLWHLHLEAFKTKARKEQAQLLSNKIRAAKAAPTIVMGDFNSISKVKANLSAAQKVDLEDSGEALTQMLKITGLQNAETPETGFTMPSWDPFKKIDHILFSKDFVLEQVETLPGVLASDHLGVAAVFERDAHGAASVAK